MDVHVATRIRGNNALVTKVQLTKMCVLTLVATDGAMIGGAQVVTTEGIKWRKQKTAGTICVETGGTTVIA